ncbi:hypothetical protein C1H76_9597 [Elsinoe australis]|uniref:Uncharacterized protein n=1 Tax=Elsinoe australis TaxID=40998 RepID=A0A4U7ARI4_9PEZI|nr:hypothetical protein C1H76_9597 [Elsinoe australis]
MYSFCLFFVLIAFVVAAQNETWTPPALFVQKRQLAQGVGDQAGGLAAFGDGGAQNTEAPTTSTIIAQKPPPSVTTTLGYTANLTSLLPQIPTNQYATITSLISCMEANGQYSATDNGTSLSAVTITVPGALTGRGTTIVSNEYTYTGCDGIPRVTWSGGTPSGLNYTIMPFTNPASLLSLTYTTKTNAPCTPDTQLASSYCNAFVTIRNEEDRIFTSASRRGTVYQDLIRTWGPPEFTCTRFDDPNPYIASCRFGVEAAELLYWPDPQYQNVSLCGSTPTITAPPNEVTSTVTINGTTFVSPSVYVKYQGISYDYSKGNYSTSWTKDITYIPFRQDAVSSVCRVGGKTLPYNYRDLYGQVPWSAWSCANDCTSLLTGPITTSSLAMAVLDSELKESYCRAIDTWRFPLKPVLAWPTTFYDVLNSLNLNDAENECDFGFWNGGIFDPPRTLTKAGSLTTPAAAPSPVTTSSVAITQAPPSPSSSLTSPASKTQQQQGPEQTASNDIPQVPDQNRASDPASYPSDPTNSESPAVAVELTAATFETPVPTSSPVPNVVGGALVSLINQPPDQSYAASTPSDQSKAKPGTVGSTSNAIQPAGSGIGALIASMLDMAPRPATASGVAVDDPTTGASAANSPVVGSTNVGGSPSGGASSDGSAAVVAGSSDGAVVEVPGSLHAVVSLQAGDPITVVQQSSNAFEVSGTTYHGGDAVALPNGHVITLASSGVVVDGVSTIAYSSVPAALPTLAVISGPGSAAAFNAGSGSGSALLGSTPVQASSAAIPSAITVDGVVIPINSAKTVASAGNVRVAYGSSGITIGSQTFEAPEAGSGVSLIMLSDGTVLKCSPVAPSATEEPPAVAVAGKVVSMNGIATVADGVSISYGTGGLVVGTQTFAVPTGTQVEFVTMENGKVLRVGGLTAVPTESKGVNGKEVTTGRGASATRIDQATAEPSRTSSNQAQRTTGAPNALPSSKAGGIQGEPPCRGFAIVLLLLASLMAL